MKISNSLQETKGLSVQNMGKKANRIIVLIPVCPETQQERLFAEDITQPEMIVNDDGL